MILTKEFVMRCRNVGALRDFLCQAIDQVDTMDEERRWRKFPEEKPNWGKEVLMLDNEGKFRVARFSHDFKWISWGKMHTCESDSILYWMPLPEPPEVK